MTDRFYPPIGTAGGDAWAERTGHVLHAGARYDMKVAADEERRQERRRLGHSLSAGGFQQIEQGDPNIGPTARQLGMETQLHWQRPYWDETINKYRTSTKDMMTGKETVVKSDYPCGYQGNRRSLKFDMLYRNTVFDEKQKEWETAPHRNAQPLAEYKKVKDRMDPIYSKDEVPDNCPTLGTIPRNTGPLGGPHLLTAPWGMFGPNYNAHGPVRPGLTLRLNQSSAVLGRTMELARQRKAEGGTFPRRPGEQTA